MEQQSKLFAGAVQAVAPFERMSHLRVDWRLAQATHLELRQLGTPRLNLFLVGPDSVTQNLIELLVSDLQGPIATWCPGKPLTLSPASQTGTIILYEVGALTDDDQRRLLEITRTATRRLQIVSTSSTPLLPRVHDGTFSETLYYRLNHIYMDLNQG